MSLPLFSSHYSVGKSVLTLEKAEKIKDNAPVSICSIAKKHDLKQVFLIDTSFSGFLEGYRNFSEIGVQLVFGVKLFVCDNVADKTDAGRVNDSKIILIAKNKDGYKELIKVYSEAATNNFYYYPRLDWTQLNEISKNIGVWVPFYDSFIFNNLFNYGVSIIPKFDKINPVFCIEDHDLPFDDLVEAGVEGFCNETGAKTIKTHSVFYYKKSDALVLNVFRCISNRTTLNKPNLTAFSSDRFSYESLIA